MKKILNNKIVKLFLFIIVISVLQYKFLKNEYLQESLLANLITFLSVIFGFYVTSLAIFVTSKYVSSLYKVTDKDNHSQTLLHTLLYNYKFGLLLTLTSIAYLILVEFVMNKHDGKFMSLENYLLYPFVAVVLKNFWYSYKMLQDLIRIILQEAKNGTHG